MPSWVDNDSDEFAAVSWSLEAHASVAAARASGALAPLYPPLAPVAAAAAEADAAACEVCCAIAEVVAQDPRALHDGFGKPTNVAYAVTFNTLRVAFEVHTGGGTGDRATAHIVEAVEDPGDMTAPVGSYQHSMALRRRAERIASQRGWKPLEWKHPVREGVLTGLYDLKRGAAWRPEDAEDE